ncbi:TetR/AcrR family transcriptional regulator [Streptomyces sp. CB03238]|uniref:TetR/AcrR family transcriptional regulator n=1 Tax=Streptomyces sp. CB03238 TaxID=1907777 RepID=UPI000A1216AE|nr:TetR/AcrR family transcriptional regulator [Streptomyces sp. CB03238]ORT58889.1 TetR family transcriptional regulator [Streptomyces sp. CB03238]
MRDSGGTGLPASIEAAWGLRERPGKGPKPGLSLERIVDAAVGLASAEGLPAVSMGRIAKELGVSTMSLYRYVGAKDELYVLMLDRAIGAPPPPPAPGTGWREALATWAREQRAALQRNLWTVRVPVSGPPVTPNSVAWWEWGMVALEGTGLDEGTKISVILLVSGYVRNEAGLMADLDAAIRATGDTPQEVMARYGRTLKRLADPGRYPAVARMLASGVMDEPDDPDYEFRFGLERLLDGIQVLVDRVTP